MFKKFVCFMLAIIMTISCVSFAEEEDATHRRGLAEFIQLYMQRISQMKEKYYMDLSDSIIDLPVLDSDGRYLIMFGGIPARVYVDKTDLSIAEAIITLTNMDYETQNEFVNNMCKAMIAMSAIEEDEYAAQLIESYHNYDDSAPADIIMKYMQFNNDYITPAIKNLETLQKIMSGEDIFVYQGSYDYYIRLESSNGKDYMCLVGKER